MPSTGISCADRCSAWRAPTEPSKPSSNTTSSKTPGVLSDRRLRPSPRPGLSLHLQHTPPCSPKSSRGVRAGSQALFCEKATWTACENTACTVSGSGGAGWARGPESHRFPGNARCGPGAPLGGGLQGPDRRLRRTVSAGQAPAHPEPPSPGLQHRLQDSLLPAKVTSRTSHRLPGRAFGKHPSPRPGPLSPAGQAGRPLLGYRLITDRQAVFFQPHRNLNLHSSDCKTGFSFK